MYTVISRLSPLEVSSKEKYIATNYDVYYLGPIIFGENSKVEYERYKNVVGHFILAGSKGVYAGLSKKLIRKHRQMTRDHRILLERWTF